MMSRKRRRVTGYNAQLAKLDEINGRLINMESGLDDLKKVAVINGALSGAVSGTLCGGLIATGITLIKLRWGG
ncbi:hypothetical protein ACBQ88_17250 [Citrobacter braakii]|uniref:hypothetical protein n=1 Tax=Citrobacter braakii TaxID=57706 RepID=UPI003523BD0E